MEQNWRSLRLVFAPPGFCEFLVVLVLIARVSWEMTDRRWGCQCIVCYQLRQSRGLNVVYSVRKVTQTNSSANRMDWIGVVRSEESRWYQTNNPGKSSKTEVSWLPMFREVLEHYTPLLNIGKKINLVEINICYWGCGRTSLVLIDIIMY